MVKGNRSEAKQRLGDGWKRAMIGETQMKTLISFDPESSKGLATLVCVVSVSYVVVVVKLLFYSHLKRHLCIPHSDSYKLWDEIKETLIRPL